MSRQRSEEVLSGGWILRVPTGQVFSVFTVDSEPSPEPIGELLNLNILLIFFPELLAQIFQHEPEFMRLNQETQV